MKLFRELSVPSIRIDIGSMICKKWAKEQEFFHKRTEYWWTEITIKSLKEKFFEKISYCHLIWFFLEFPVLNLELCTHRSRLLPITQIITIHSPLSSTFFLTLIFLLLISQPDSNETFTISFLVKNKLTPTRW